MKLLLENWREYLNEESISDDVMREIVSYLHSTGRTIDDMGIEQDVIPGMAQHFWFVPKKTGNYDIVCAELCGWGHYKMKGRLTVQTRDEFDEWLADLYAYQESTTGSDSE